MQPGDRIVSIAGQPVDDTRDVGDLIRPRVDQPVPIVLERDGKQLTVTVTPIRNVVPVLDADGVPVVNADGTPQTTEAGFLGVRSSPPVAYVPQSPTAVPGILWSFVSGTAEAIVHVPERMVRGLAGRVQRRRARGRQPDVGRRRRPGRR